ncbi:hypothetical protein PGTUg99_036500 [Puccinia graminis f. sp. tritici]|uniref:Uncharacterized protein n=1 Tax=Puccinia graminis f. sp. tritici TaxID=56615 RepID=A0A5B0QV67_PUCGR|nr:hypothetical protein PGTUg99_036500 [Puccinia graminis f. sp. tritici]
MVMDIEFGIFKRERQSRLGTLFSMMKPFPMITKSRVQLQPSMLISLGQPLAPPQLRQHRDPTPAIPISPITSDSDDGTSSLMDTVSPLTLPASIAPTPPPPADLPEPQAAPSPASVPLPVSRPPTPPVRLSGRVRKAPERYGNWAKLSHCPALKRSTKLWQIPVKKAFGYAIYSLNCLFDLDQLFHFMLTMKVQKLLQTTQSTTPGQNILMHDIILYATVSRTIFSR